MEPPNAQPRAPKSAKYGARRRQSSLPERRAMARADRAPGTMAPASCPKFPRMPQPIESERPTARTARKLGSMSRRLSPLLQLLPRQDGALGEDRQVDDRALLRREDQADLS